MENYVMINGQKYVPLSKRGFPLFCTSKKDSRDIYGESQKVLELSVSEVGTLIELIEEGNEENDWNKKRIEEYIEALERIHQK